MKIFKYPLQGFGTQKIDMHKHSSVLSIQMQKNLPVMWVLSNPDLETETRIFKTYGTGNEFDDQNKVYISTYQFEHFVYHVFEERELEKVNKLNHDPHI